MGSAWATGEGDLTGMAQLGYSSTALIIDGVINIGTNAAPVWRNFATVCLAGGTPETFVGATATAAAFLSATTIKLFHQVFAAQSTGTSRTPAGLALEHTALVLGDFPWDTVNGRPHHDAIRALAGSGANPFLNYQGLVTAQNAATLPYANLRTEGGAQGRGAVELWFSLSTLTAGLVNQGSITSSDLSITTQASNPNPLETVASIAPAHWAAGIVPPAITVPDVRFVGGRGTRPVIRAGTYDAVGTASLQRRYVYGTGAVNTGAVAGEAVPGFDWATTGITLNAGAFTSTAALPVGGPYTLQVRDAAAPTVEAIPLTDNIVGTVMTLWGQSGAGLALRTGFGATTLGPNLLNVAVASGALGVAMRLNNNEAGGASYLRPAPATTVLRQGETPAVGHGFVLAVNEWAQHNPGHPLIVVVPAVNGTSMVDWANDALVLTSPTWKFMGTKTVPGAAAADGSGIVGYLALLLDSHVDLHTMMWTPGIADTLAGRAAWTAAIDARFTNAAAAPWLIFPPWRGHRDLPDLSATVETRADSVAYVTELGGRGALGPYWPDIVSDGSGSLHAAHNTSAASPNTGNPVSDGNSVGQGRLGRGIGRAAAWVWERKIKAGAFNIAGAWFVDGGRTQIRVDLSRQVRTLNAAAMANRFSISTNNGVTWPLAGVGFTAALDAGARSVTLTISSGSWAATNVRVDYCREWPSPPSQVADEANAEAALHGLLYDNQVFRGNTNLASPAGNVLASTNRIGAGVAGVGVAAKAAAKLVTSARFAGTRNVLVRLMASDGITVLREKSLAITAS